VQDSELAETHGLTECELRWSCKITLHCLAKKASYLPAAGSFVGSPTRRCLLSCENSRHKKQRNENKVRSEKYLARHPNLYLQTGRWNRAISNTHMRNVILYEQRSPVCQSSYCQFGTKNLVVQIRTTDYTEVKRFRETSSSLDI
jgi:hypothetical protein